MWWILVGTACLSMALIVFGVRLGRKGPKMKSQTHRGTCTHLLFQFDREEPPVFTLPTHG